ncbi:MAG TPA: hypothetical protein DCM28_16675 [Phycisphaerales bacterium]|nr:hypothetical protein [Phycisphaerales bacterium]HCD33329.1 hypothetical protein [Phycisphaerales bacterium]|tara:strand:+ start:755 stop:1375 length:621 start_codon:yes stop_codon:yes gene_type:complete
MNRTDLPLPNPMMLPFGLQQILENELDKGETLLWLDQPDGSRMARSSLPIMLFAIPWTAFSCFWMLMASKGSLLFAAFGIPFVLIGLGMLSSPFWAKRAAGKTVYALTDKRAIIIAGKFKSMTVTSYRPEQLTEMDREQRADGSGSLIFERIASTHTSHRPAGSVHRHGSRSRTHTTITPKGFLHIKQVKAVEDLVEGMVASHLNS